MDTNYQYRWQQFAHRLIGDLVHNPVVTLPGVRTLKVKYKVSQDTIDHGLRHLEELGVISPAEPGKSRRINQEKLEEIARLQGRGVEKRVLFISGSPRRLLSFMSRDTYETLHVLCERENLSLEYVETPPTMKDLRNLLVSLRPCGIILYKASEVMAEVVVSLGIPSVGISTGPLRIPTFNASYENLFVRAFEQAWKAGHQRVTAPVWNATEARYENLAEALETHFARDGATFSRHFNLPEIHGETVGDYCAVLHELFRFTPPTCILLKDMSHYLAASSFFLQRKLAIPGDVSVIFLSHDPELKYIQPAPAHFIRYSDDMVQQVFNTLQEQMTGLRSCEDVELVPIWVPGESLATPKAG